MEMPSIESLTRRAGDLNNAVDSWNSAMILSLVLAALAAIAVVVTTRLALVRTKQLSETQAELLKAKDDQLALDLKEKDLRIAEANERANTASLELAKFKSPRSLSAEQISLLVSAMGKFGNIQFDGAVGPVNDPEPMVFFDQIAKGLSAAGWRQIAWQAPNIMILTRSNGTPNLGGVSVTNVIIDIHPNNAPSLWLAAQTLAATLTEAGIAAIAEQGAGNGNTNEEAVHILIGRKM